MINFAEGGVEEQGIERVRTNGFREKNKNFHRYFTRSGLSKTNKNNMEEKEKTGGQNRQNIRIGSHVEVVQKQNQRSGRLTEGVVARILTKSPKHPHGIKVMLESGIVGRVKWVVE